VNAVTVVARAADSVWGACLLTAVAVTVATLVAPHVHVGARAAHLVTFVGVALVATTSMAVGARRRTSGRITAIIDVVAFSFLVFLSRASIDSRWIAVIIDTTLVAIAAPTGAFIGHRLPRPGNLLPVCAVAAAVDVVSVLAATGATRVMAANESLFSVFALSFPVPGKSFAEPTLGLGDFVFLALVCGLAARHALPYLRTAILGFVGVLAAGLLSTRFLLPMPAIPTIAAAVLIGVPGARRVTRSDRAITAVAIVVALVVAGYAVLTRKRG